MTTVTEGVEVYMDGYQELHVELPFNVDGREHDAEYIESTRTIKYRAPYLPYEELLRRHRENPPLELGSVEGLSMDFLDLDYEYKPKDAEGPAGDARDSHVRPELRLNERIDHIGTWLDPPVRTLDSPCKSRFPSVCSASVSPIYPIDPIERSERRRALFAGRWRPQGYAPVRLTKVVAATRWLPRSTTRWRLSARRRSRSSSTMWTASTPPVDKF